MIFFNTTNRGYDQYLFKKITDPGPDDLDYPIDSLLYFNGALTFLLDEINRRRENKASDKVISDQEEELYARMLAETVGKNLDENTPIGIIVDLDDPARYHQLKEFALSRDITLFHANFVTRNEAVLLSGMIRIDANA